MDETHDAILGALLGELTDIQLKAVRWQDDPLLVLAGPGSGKTRVLTCRIARILASSRDRPFRVLGLTFTNKAADEMRDRVERMVPGQSHRLFLGTFHSFCAEVLRQHGVHLGIKPDFRIYSSEDDRQSVLDEALKKAAQAGHEVGDADRAVLPVIERLKSRLVAPDNAYAHLEENGLRERIGFIYEHFEAELNARNALDFSSLIYYAHSLFSQFPAFARRYRTVYQYWCVDEFQDTNEAQYALIRAMAGGEFRNIFIVADDDQIIYQWNGASHRRIEEFKRDFSPDVVQLPTNYRCPPEIVDMANNLIRYNLFRTPDKEPLIAAKSPSESSSETVRILHYDSDTDEAQAIAKDIVQRFPCRDRDVAVLARNRKLLELMKDELDRTGIPAAISQRRDNFVSPPFVWLHCCLRLCNNRRDAKAMNAVAGSFAQMTGSRVDVPKLIDTAKAKHGDYLREWVTAICLGTEGDSAVAAARAVGEFLVRRNDYSAFCAFATKWFDEIVACGDDAGSGELFEGYAEDKRAWGDLYHDIRASLPQSAELEAFLHELELRSKAPSISPGTVILMTIHSAKGKEFDHVYLTGLVEDQMPSYQSRKRGPQSPEMEEERRNCFVAITRARKTLTLSYADTYGGWTKRASRFLDEMGIELEK